jgi:hypothetical protein
LDDVEDDLRKTGVKHWRITAVDRTEWRKICEVAKVFQVVVVVVVWLHSYITIFLSAFYFTTTVFLLHLSTNATTNQTSLFLTCLWLTTVFPQVKY